MLYTLMIVFDLAVFILGWTIREEFRNKNYINITFLGIVLCALIVAPVIGVWELVNALQDKNVFYQSLLFENN